MKHTDEDMTCYLKAVVITIIFLLALSGTDRNCGNNPIRKVNLLQVFINLMFGLYLLVEQPFLQYFFPLINQKGNQTVNEKNKIAFDSRLVEQRLKTLGKSREIIIPFPQLHINFQLIPLKQDDPPALS